MSPLAGKLFDQTGDRLTPSHTKTAKGRRLRYYVSHRLIRGSAPRDPSGWRLPAPDVEQQVAKMIEEHLNKPEIQAAILSDASTEEIAALPASLAAIAGEQGGANPSVAAHLALADRIDIAPGEIRIALSAQTLSLALYADADRIAEDLLAITSPFQHRKRGVETKLVLGDALPEIDETLLRNIARGHRYFELVRAGRTFGEIAATEQVSKRRVQQLIDLAFLAPDVIRTVRGGKQPAGLTSEWLMRHAVSPIWQDQRDLFATL